MKRLLIIFIFLLPFFANAQRKMSHVIFISKDSIKGWDDLTTDWKFHGGDDSLMAGTNFNDSNWIVLNPGLWLTGHRKDGLDTFNSIGWFRLHLLIDTTVAGRPLAIQMSHYGASEIYLDGKKIRSWGKIKGKDSTKYLDPKYTPFIITFPTAGEHVMAVRYANYNAKKNDRVYRRDQAGFYIRIGEVDTITTWREYQLRANTLVFISMLLNSLSLVRTVVTAFLGIPTCTRQNN